MRALRQLLLSTATLLALLASGNTATAQGSGGDGDACPNEKASQVSAEIVTTGGYTRCGLSIKIFGFGGTIFGAKCYLHETRTPAHQECQGDTLEGSRCVHETDLIVETRDCACGGLVVPVIDTGFPVSCICGDWYSNGTVEDFKTEECTP